MTGIIVVKYEERNRATYCGCSEESELSSPFSFRKGNLYFFYENDYWECDVGINLKIKLWKLRKTTNLDNLNIQNICLVRL